ncbi:MAG: hypothetical protein BGP01_13825 [Paludibacter sp. 47-17]|nr:MAG: hypothetical protein BGP01_13825 [Paludibacter sp. 47-17]
MQLTIRQLLLPASALTGFALLQTLALLPVANIYFWQLLPDSLLHSLGCGLLAIPLLNVVRFSRLEAVSPTLRFVNYSMYVAVATAAAAGSAYLAELVIFGPDTAAGYQTLIPLRALLNACIFSGILVCVKTSDKESEITEIAPEAGDFPIDRDIPKPAIPDRFIESPMEASRQNNIHSEPAEQIDPTPSLAANPALTAISYTTRIALRSGTKIHVVPIDEVLYLQADGDYVQVVTPQGRFLKEQTLKSFAGQLPPERFARVHRSILVNIEAISRIERYEKNTQQLRLKNGDTVKVSQQGYKLLRQQLGL